MDSKEKSIKTPEFSLINVILAEVIFVWLLTSNTCISLQFDNYLLGFFTYMWLHMGKRAKRYLGMSLVKYVNDTKMKCHWICVLTFWHDCKYDMRVKFKTQRAMIFRWHCQISFKIRVIIWYDVLTLLETEYQNNLTTIKANCPRIIMAFCSTYAERWGGETLMEF